MAHEFSASYKDYFHDMPIDLFCVLRADSRQVVHANGSFENMLGWKPEEVIGHAMDIFLSVESEKANIEKLFSKIRLGIHSLSFETEFRAKNNLTRFIDWKCYVDTDSQLVFAIGRDITSHKESLKALMQQSHLDHLTGVCDRQTFMTVLANEINSAVRYHYPTALVTVDIDGFKAYNEKFGDLKGDECLRQVATALRTCLRRKTDFLARYENDEFSVMLTHNNLEQATKVAEYLRSNLEKLVINHLIDQTKHSITISLGIAVIPETMKKEIPIERFINTARHALGISQQRGGNQISYAENAEV